MIKLLKVSKVYTNGTKALNNVNLNVDSDISNSFVFLVGPTGSGKSTLLKLLYREELPTSGEVIVGGINVQKLAPRQIPAFRQRIGVIFQDFKILPQKTVWDNIAFALEILGMPQREQNKKVRAALELTGISHLAKNYPNQLSGGEQQCVSVARAIVNKPPILLADEPTGNLDPEASWDIMRLLAKINRSGTVVIVCTHNKLIVDSMKRRVIQLEKGKIVKDTEQGGYPVGIDK